MTGSLRDATRETRANGVISGHSGSKDFFAFFCLLGRGIMSWKEITTRSGQIFDRINNGIILVLQVIFVIGFLAVCVSVLTRYLFNMPILWVIGSTEYMLAAIGFLGAAWLLKMDGHVRQDTVTVLLSPRIQAILRTITSFLGLCTCVIIGWYAAKTALDYHHRQVMNVSTILIPVAPMLGFVAIGFFLLSIQFVRDTYNYFYKWLKPPQGREPETLARRIDSI
jgi:TRAP-type C4-dicarboxylate transport system permease small subunit